VPWNEFKTCMVDADRRLGDAMEHLGEDAVHVLKQIAELWRMLPLDVRAMLIASLRWGGRYLIAALAAAGVEAGAALTEVGEFLAAGAAGFGAGYFMAALVDCSSHL